MKFKMNRLLAIFLSCAMLCGMLLACAEEVPASVGATVVETEALTAEQEEAAAETTEPEEEPDESADEAGEPEEEPEESADEAGEPETSEQESVEPEGEPEESVGESAEPVESDEAAPVQLLTGAEQRTLEYLSFSNELIDILHDGTGYLQEIYADLTYRPYESSDCIKLTVDDPSIVRIETSDDRPGRISLLIKGIKPGETTITATAMDGSGLSDSLKVIVFPEPRFYSVSFSKNPIQLGETVTVNVCTSAEGIRKLTYGFSNPRTYLGETTQKTVVGDKAYWSFQATPAQDGDIGFDLKIDFTSPAGWEMGIGGSAILHVSDGRTKPESIYINRQDDSEAPLNIGDLCQLEFWLYPENSHTTVTWKSSDPNVASVDSTGIVTAVGGGEATITATTANKKTDSCKIRVVDAYQPTAVTLDRTGTVKLNMGDTLTLTPSLVPATAQATFSWASSNAKVATVDNGVVTPVGEGTAAITVSAIRGSVRKTAFVNVSVVDPYKLTAVTLDRTGTVNLNMGDTLTLTPSLAPETAQADYSWISNNVKVATVDHGVVTPVGEGTATITVTATRGKIKKTATVKVKVVDPYKPTGVKLDKTGTVNLNLGESLTLTPSLSPETAQATYSWKTSSSKIATVADGAVTPVGEGTATITVTATRGNIKKTATVKVKVVDPYKPTAVKLDKTGTVNLNLGETLTLTPSLSPETAQATYSWKTSSTKIATVADGVVTPVSEGTATITVTATRGKIKKTATVKVKVVDPYKPTSLKLRETGTVWLDLGDSRELTPILTPDTAKATYSWKSSSTKIATVDENGVVRSVSKGTATITVTAKRGNVTKTASVKVKVVEPYVVDALSFGHVDSPGDLKILVGELSYITVGVKPASASKTANLSFSLSNGNVYLSHKATGEIRVLGVQPGTTTITVKDVNTGVKATMKVVVRNRKA